VHTEKFWRENAKFVEADNFKALKELIALLGSRDPVRMCCPFGWLFSCLDIQRPVSVRPDNCATVRKIYLLWSGVLHHCWTDSLYFSRKTRC
jgi:hypothetical protein